MESQLAAQSSLTGEERPGWAVWNVMAPKVTVASNLDEEDCKLSLSVFVPPRATLDPPVPLVLLEKTAPKVLEETLAPLAELVTLVFKVLQDLLARKESLGMTVPL